MSRSQYEFILFGQLAALTTVFQLWQTVKLPKSAIGKPTSLRSSISISFSAKLLIKEKHAGEFSSEKNRYFIEKITDSLGKVLEIIVEIVGERLCIVENGISTTNHREFIVSL